MLLRGACVLLVAGAANVLHAGETVACAHAPAELHALAFPNASNVVLSQAKTTEYAFAASAECLERPGERTSAMLVRIVASAEPVNLHLISVSGKEATLPARIELLDENFAVLRS